MLSAINILASKKKLRFEADICEARLVLADSEVIEETFRTAQSSCAPRSGETRPQSQIFALGTALLSALTQWFHDLHFGEVGDDLGQFGWAFHELGLREEEYVHTWDREAYLRAIATEPRWMEVLDRLCADQI